MLLILHRRIAAAVGLCLITAGCASMPVTDEPSEAPRLQALARTEPPSYFVYEVNKGDTLYSIGRRFGVSWSEIAEDNGIASPDELRVDTPLLIRRIAGAPPAAESAPERPLPAPARRPVAKSRLHRGKPSSQLWWPADGRLVRTYGEPWRGMAEPGLAIAASAGTEVCAAAAGTVQTCTYGADVPGSAWGNVIVIDHGLGSATSYAHLGDMFVREGEHVDQGQPIGTVGASGAVGQPTLAFRVFRDERPIDPRPHLP